MSPPSFRQPGDIVNEIYSENIQIIIQMCNDVGDDPKLLIEEAKRELQVLEKSSCLFHTTKKPKSSCFCFSPL